MIESSGWRDELARIHANALERNPIPKPWPDVQKRAHTIGTIATVSFITALSLDELHDASLGLPEADVIEAAIRSGIDPAIIDHYPESAVLGVTNSIKGSLMEIRVDELIQSGELPLPEGAVDFELASRTAEGLDGYFFDDEGNLIQVMQIKASSSDFIIQEHLERFPEIESVYSTTEAATSASEHGLEGVIDTGISDEVLMSDVGELFDSSLTLGESIDEVVPQLTLLFTGAELAWNLYKGLDKQEALQLAGKRAGKATGYSTAAWFVSHITGVESARLVLVIGGESYSWVVSRLDAEVAPSISHMTGLRSHLSGLGFN